MTELTAKKCSMCQVRDMVFAPYPREGATEYLVCPNCDSPTGHRINNSYDGIGPKK